MRKLNLLLAAASALTLAAGAASAQTWLPIVERQAMLEDRIDAGLTTGDITPAEARLLRSDLTALVILEGRYRYGGLSARERLDLDRRYGDLDDRARMMVRTNAPMPWTSLEDRKLQLDDRIERGLRSGDLTSAEAAALRDDFDSIASVEASYRVDGISAAEGDDLARRFDELSARIRVARNDADREYGWNRR